MKVYKAEEMTKNEFIAKLAEVILDMGIDEIIENIPIEDKDDFINFLNEFENVRSPEDFFHTNLSQDESITLIKKIKEWLKSTQK